MLKPNTYDGLLFVTAEGPPGTACRVLGPRGKGWTTRLQTPGGRGFSSSHFPRFLQPHVVLSLENGDWEAS